MKHIETAWYVFQSNGQPFKWSKSETKRGAITWWDSHHGGAEDSFASRAQRLGLTVRRVTVEWEG